MQRQPRRHFRLRSRLPIIAAWVLGALAVALIDYRDGGAAGGTYAKEHFPEFDLIVLIGTLILPWATPFIIYATGMEPTAYTSPGYYAGDIDLADSDAGHVSTAAWTVVGLAQVDDQRCVMFYAIFAFFFTTMFTNPTASAPG
jgi:hypothetical protein